ncbi:MAG: response regulator [Bacteriovoracaceae bacterium]|nr:response regulator [Bacteriovoracaceae bacterium]
MSKTQANKLKLLIVDDDEEVAEVIAMLFEDYFDVTILYGSAQVYQDLEKVTNDLFLIDLKMPEVTGVEVVKKLKTLYPHNPIFIMSGFSEKDDIVIEALDAGAKAFISKPIWEPDKVAQVMIDAHTTYTSS